jgi:hypothetical protein
LRTWDAIQVSRRLVRLDRTASPSSVVRKETKWPNRRKTRSGGTGRWKPATALSRCREALRVDLARCRLRRVRGRVGVSRSRRR